MADEENKTIRTAATIGTSPIWVPVAAAGGVIYGAGVLEAKEFGKKHGSVTGIAASSFIVAGNILKGPIKGIKKVGNAMVAKDKE